ncbi:hypothetical protein ACHAXR_001755 [Thalassiosira sp. AJA248-18]
MRRSCIASKENDEDEEADFDETASPIVDTTENSETPITANALSPIFLLFSYCIQFLGAFFFCGLILNLLGFGYTVDLERGLNIDRIDNIRNEVQFEREMQREEMEDLKGSASSKYIIAPVVPENNVVSVGDQ